MWITSVEVLFRFCIAIMTVIILFSNLHSYVFLTYHITHKLSLLSTYVSPTSGRDAMWRCFRVINFPGWSLQSRLHPHPDMSHPNWMEENRKTKEKTQGVSE